MKYFIDTVDFDTGVVESSLELTGATEKLVRQWFKLDPEADARGPLKLTGSSRKALQTHYKPKGNKAAGNHPYISDLNQHDYIVRAVLDPLEELVEVAEKVLSGVDELLDNGHLNPDYCWSDEPDDEDEESLDDAWETPLQKLRTILENYRKANPK